MNISLKKVLTSTRFLKKGLIRSVSNCYRNNWSGCWELYWKIINCYKQV